MRRAASLLAGGALVAAAAGPLAGLAVTATPAVARSQASCESGDLVADPGWAPDAIGLARAHEHATGRGVRVAVVDSGVLDATPHLAGAVEAGLDVLSPGSPGTVDETGHGTAVASILAARAVEGSGLLGVAPDATVVPIRVYEAETDAAEEANRDPQPGRIAAGIRAALTQDVRVIVVAMSSTVDDAELAAAVREATAAGALVVASMGNLDDLATDPARPRYPAAYPEVLAVGGFDQAFGEVPAYRGAHADVGGPGAVVLATGETGHDCVIVAPGTSWSTAYAGGVAALLAQMHPDETPAQWTRRITATAARSDPDHRSDLTGWGLVQAADALAFVDDGSARGPVGDVEPTLTRPVPVVEPVRVAVPPDPWEQARARVGWWGLGAAVVVAGAVVATRVAPRARRERAGA